MHGIAIAVIAFLANATDRGLRSAICTEDLESVFPYIGETISMYIPLYQFRPALNVQT